MNREKKVQEWIESGEFLSDIEDVRSEILKKANSADNESQTASAFENALYYLIRVKTGIEVNFSKETSLGNVIHKFGSLAKRKSKKGRLDAVVNNLVIEYKHHSKLKTKQQYEAACQQVKDYLLALKENDGVEYDSIITDGLKIAYISFQNGTINCSKLSSLGRQDLELIVKAIVYNDKKKFAAKNIVNDFSISSSVPSPSRNLALELYTVLSDSPTYKTHMLFEEWLSLIHLSFEDNGKSGDIKKRRDDLSLIFNDTINSSEKEYKSLWALQTTYAIIVKLIACKVVDKLDYSNNTRQFYDLSSISPDDMQAFFEKMEDGYSYRNSNVSNFLEGDFFSWYSDKKQWNKRIFTAIREIIKLINDYSSFNINVVYEPVDIFKDLYMGIIPKSVRHSMGEYFTPNWLADYVITNSIKTIHTDEWKAIDPCCGSGIFLVALIKQIVGNVNIQQLSEKEKEHIQNEITNRVYGIDINPLSVLSARVGYYLALQPFGSLKNIEIPVYLGDSAILPSIEYVDQIECYKYSVSNEKLPFDVVLPARFVKSSNFASTMSELQAGVKTNNSEILFNLIINEFTETERKSKELLNLIRTFAENLVYLHENNWDGIWVRISTNFMLIARLSEFDLIVGNPPWVKWEHLPRMYANKIKELCNIKHIFSNDGGQFGGTQLNICALISNVAATNWLKKNGVLAFLMPDSIMSQNSYEEFRNFYLDYEKRDRLYLQKLDKWEAPLRPFRSDGKTITQDFNTYYFSSKKVDYSKGIPVTKISRLKNVSDDYLNQFISFEKMQQFLVFDNATAAQLSSKSTAFSYISSKYDYSLIIGKTDYQYRTGVEFTPQELYMLVGLGRGSSNLSYRFANKKFSLSKYNVDDMPLDGWDLPTKYIYPIVTSTVLDNFKYTYSNEYCILPYNENNTRTPVSTDVLMKNQKELFSYLLSHQDLIAKQSEKSKQMHRGDEFYALSKIGQYTFAPYIVAARDNTRFCAAVVKPTLTGWGEKKQCICVKHTIVISQDINNNNISEKEAYYISGILNSSIVINYIHDSFKKNGFSLNKSNLYLPKYNPNSILHNQIADLSLKAEKEQKDTSEYQETLTQLYLSLCTNKKSSL